MKLNDFNENKVKVMSVAARTFNEMKLILVLCSFLFSFAGASKILGIFPFGSKSHYTIGEATMKALHEAGHEVTMISVFELKKPLENYHQIKIVDQMETIVEGTITDNN
jgi:hypothetical protein